MKNIIFFDIDGTLITEDYRMLVPESTAKAIELTRKKGNLTFINTGRTEFNVIKKVRDLGFDGYLCGCGTYIEFGGEGLLYHTQEKDMCLKIAEICQKSGVSPVYERRDGYFFDDDAAPNDGIEYFKKIFAGSDIRVDQRVTDEDFSFDKFVFWTNPGSDTEFIFNSIRPYFQIIDRGGGFYENVPIGYSKATAIDMMLKKLDIPLENAYAIGDSTNDLPMLEAVPNSIAMGGSESIYPYVSYITTGIENDGIYNALDHFGLI